MGRSITEADMAPPAVRGYLVALRHQMKEAVGHDRPVRALDPTSSSCIAGGKPRHVGVSLRKE